MENRSVPFSACDATMIFMDRAVANFRSFSQFLFGLRVIYLALTVGVVAFSAVCLFVRIEASESLPAGIIRHRERGLVTLAASAGAPLGACVCGQLRVRALHPKRARLVLRQPQGLCDSGSHAVHPSQAR